MASDVGSAAMSVGRAYSIFAERWFGRWRLIVGAAWIMLAVLVLGLFVAGLPPRWDELRLEFQRHSGFDAFQNSDGDILVSPWAGGPAAAVGVLERDILVAVNGTPVSGALGIAMLQTAAEGPIGNPLLVDVRTGARPVRSYAVVLGGDEARPLARLGLSYTVVAGYITAIDAIAAAVLIAIAGLLVRRTPRKRLPLLASTTMLAFVAGSAPVIALYRSQLEWQSAVDVLFGLAFVCVLAFFFLFPDGQFVPGWTRFATGAIGVWFVAAPVFPMLYPWRSSGWSGLLMLVVPLSVGLLAQGYRYARVSTSRQRQQTKWVVFGGVLATIGLALQLGVEVVGDRYSTIAVVRDQVMIRPIGQILMCLLPVSIAIALFRYRLWDIDLILHRALVYGLLTTTIAGVDAMVVGGIGATLALEGNPVVSLLAAGLVAVLFQPLRVWIQRAVDRLLYGDRDDPYAVMSRLSRQLSATLAQDSVLPTVVKSVRDALKLPYAAIALGHDEEHILAASGEPVSTQLTLPLHHRGELVGELRVSPRGPGEGWTSGERRLLEDLARQAGSAVQAVRLTTDLQRLSDELQQARERLVLAREEERRRLRRDLHDELAPSLAALGLTAAAARDLLGTESGAAVRLLEDLRAGLRVAVGDIRRIAYELRPPVLDELGLVAAIRERAARLDGSSDVPKSRATEPRLHVVVQAPDQLPSLAAAVEVATYRIVQEALMNVVRHAAATTCLVRLSLNDGLDIEVVDNGIGQATNARPGIGLRSMRERALELGGRFTIEQASPSGTRVRVHLPFGKEPTNGLAASPDRG